MIRTRLKRMPNVVTVRNGDGVSVNLISEGLLKCSCHSCQVVFYIPTNTVMCCPACAGRDIEKVWTRPQTLLVPESESPTFKVSGWKREK